MERERLTMFNYQIRRYSKYNYGEVIMRGNKLKDCLKYLKDNFKVNNIDRIERHDFTFIAYGNTPKLYRIEKERV